MATTTRTAKSGSAGNGTKSTAKTPSGTRKPTVRKGQTLARWTEDQVKVLMDAVDASPTAKAGFSVAADILGKSHGTVQQKYYALQKKAGSNARRGRRRGRPSGSTGTARVVGQTGLSSSFLTNLNTDQLVTVAKQVKAEVERRRTELDKASELFG